MSHKLNALSGCAQRVLFNIIEEVAHQGECLLKTIVIDTYLIIHLN